MTPPIRYVLFDAGGTLLGTNTDCEHWYEQFFVDTCAECGCKVTVEQVRSVLHHAAQACTLEQRCSTPEQVRSFWEHMYSAVFGELVPRCDALTLARHYIDRFESGEYVELFSDTLPALQRLRQLQMPMGIVSNFGTYLRTFLEHTGIADFFEFVVVSAAEGCEKPHPEIFQIALARTQQPPENVLFAGDHPKEDYEASRRLGMRAVLVDRHAKFRDRTDLTRISRLTEIEQLL